MALFFILGQIQNVRRRYGHHPADKSLKGVEVKLQCNANTSDSWCLLVHFDFDYTHVMVTNIYILNQIPNATNNTFLNNSNPT